MTDDHEREHDDDIRPVPEVYALGEPSGVQNLPYTGRLEVVTQSGSRYLLDLEFELLTRIRGTEQPADPKVGFPAKFRDHERGAVRLLRVVRLAVGEPAVFDIESLSTNPAVAFTRRTTTCVTDIHQLESDREEG